MSSVSMFWALLGFLLGFIAGVAIVAVLAAFDRDDEQAWRAIERSDAVDGRDAA